MIVNWAAVALFSAMVVVTTLGVFFRYVLNNALPWAEEADRYLFIWLSFVGASITMRHKAHIAVDLLLRYVSPRWRHWLALVAQGCVLVFLGVGLLGQPPGHRDDQGDAGHRHRHPHELGVPRRSRRAAS